MRTTEECELFEEIERIVPAAELEGMRLLSRSSAVSACQTKRDGMDQDREDGLVFE